MEKSQIKKLETTQDKEPWYKPDSEQSKEIFEKVFKVVFRDLQTHPNLYYIKVDDSKGFTEVYKRADNSMIYHTNNLAERGMLEDVGLEK